MEIRELQIEDIPKIWKINFECWRKNYKWIIDDVFLNGITIERWIEKAKIYYNKPEVFALVKEIEWEIIWFIDGHANNEKEFEINRLYVDPIKQWEWHGKELFMTFINNKNIKKYPNIMLFTLKDNPQSRWFYEKLGWTLWIETKKAWWEKEYPIVEYRRER